MSMHISGKKFKIVASSILAISLILSLHGCMFKYDYEKCSTIGVKKVPFKEVQQHFQEYADEVKFFLMDFYDTITVETSGGVDETDYDVIIQAEVNTDSIFVVRFMSEWPKEDRCIERFCVTWQNTLSEGVQAKQEVGMHLMLEIYKIVTGVDYFDETFLSEFLTDTSGKYDDPDKKNEYISKSYHFGRWDSDWSVGYRAYAQAFNPVITEESFWICGIPKTGQNL